jgi:hypothetical protein
MPNGVRPSLVALRRPEAELVVPAPIGDADMNVQAETLELVGLAEAAELLGISKAALWERRYGRCDQANRPPSFPEPVAVLKCGPIWLRGQIEEYKRTYEEHCSAGWEGEIDPVRERELMALVLPADKKKDLRGGASAAAPRARS